MSPEPANLRKAVPDNDDRAAAPKPGFRSALVSDGVWSRLLRLKREGGIGPDQAWSLEERSAWSLYAPLAAADGRPLVFAQIGQSLDGRIATESGDARNVSGPDGLKHLHRCRALADAVIVGVRTALADSPRLTVRLVEGDDPARVVVDPNGRLADGDGLFSRPGRSLVIRRAGRPRPEAPQPAKLRSNGVEIVHIDAPERHLDPRAIVAALSRRGFHRILVEGGGTTIGRFLDAGALDRLHVSIAPLLIGAGPSGLTATPVARLSQALRPQVTAYGIGSDVVFDCALERHPGRPPRP